MDASNFEEKARALHGTTYIYSKVQYAKANEKVIIICPKHGEFLQTPSKHVNYRQGCPSCGGTKKLTLAVFRERSEKAHGAMACHYDYSNTVLVENSDKKVEIICKIHGSFTMTPQKHMSGQGCKKCKSVFSLAAIAWLEYLAHTQNSQIQHALKGGEKSIEINGKTYYVDGYCPQTNTVYQFHGDFYHGNPAIYNADAMNKRTGKTFGELFSNTRKIEDLILSQGYVLETIWETDWKALCQKKNINPLEPCQNPDYVCPSAQERNCESQKRSADKKKLRMKSEPEYRAHVAANLKRYQENNRERLRLRNKEYYAANRSRFLEYQANRRQTSKLLVEQTK